MTRDVKGNENWSNKFKLDQQTPSVEIKKTVFLSVNFTKFPGADMPATEDSMDTERLAGLDVNRPPVTGVQVRTLRQEPPRLPRGTDCARACSLR